VSTTSRNYAWLSNEQALKLWNELLLKAESESCVDANLGGRRRRRSRA
jgi:hypothetical protein